MKRILACLMSAVFIMVITGCPMPTRNGADNENDNMTNNGQEINFTATLTGDSEVPLATGTGSGSGTFTLNADQTELSFDISASGLTGPVTGSHFHNAPAGEAGDIVFDVTTMVTQASDGTVTIVGTWPISDANITNLLAGNLYINVHTAENPPGELRGQVLAVE